MRRFLIALVFSVAAGCAAPQPKIVLEIASQLASRGDRMVIAGPCTTTEELDSVIGFHFTDVALANSVASSELQPILEARSGQPSIESVPTSPSDVYTAGGKGLVGEKRISE